MGSEFGHSDFSVGGRSDTRSNRSILPSNSVVNTLEAILASKTCTPDGDSGSNDSWERLGVKTGQPPEAPSHNAAAVNSSSEYQHGALSGRSNTFRESSEFGPGYRQEPSPLVGKPLPKSQWQPSQQQQPDSVMSKEDGGGSRGPQNTGTRPNSIAPSQGRGGKVAAPISNAASRARAAGRQQQQQKQLLNENALEHVDADVDTEHNNFVSCKCESEEKVRRTLWFVCGGDILHRACMPHKARGSPT